MNNDKYKIILGVTGGIAAYKALLLTRLFVKNNYSVNVIMTEGATKFVAPLSFEVLSQNPVLIDLWKQNHASSNNLWTKHIDLAENADALIIAPTTAQTLAKIANGFCDNLLTAVALAFRKKHKFLAPAMDEGMWENPAVRKNIRILNEYGWKILEPASGFLASGLTGKGRMQEPEDIFEQINLVLNSNPFLQNKKILITAGPTREPLDKVRFLTNYSTGKMGIALAKKARQAGAEVLLITGPISQKIPQNIQHIPVETAEEMFQAVKKHFADQDILIMSAAVADFTPEIKHEKKIKKQGQNELLLRLKRTKDILKFLGENKNPKQYLVGFALETEPDLVLAYKKLHTKNADMIVFNTLADTGAGFGHPTNKVTLITRSGREIPLPLMSKEETAEHILRTVHEELREA